MKFVFNAIGVMVFTFSIDTVIHYFQFYKSNITTQLSVEPSTMLLLRRDEHRLLIYGDGCTPYRIYE